MKSKAFVSVCVLLVSVTVSSCATMKTNPFIGGAIGATSGALAGSALGAPESSVPGAFIGAGIGVALGAFIGMLTSKNEQSKSGTQRGSEQFQGIQSEAETPALTAPQVRRTWVKDHVENDQFIKGHYIYSIERSSQWISP